MIPFVKADWRERTHQQASTETRGNSVAAPNFFIAGAPRCGTTALYEYLREHPDIYMCRPKEPNYFCEDLPGYRFVTQLDDYLALFIEASSGQTMIGEASPWYLYSEVAISNIYRYNPEAKIVVMLRNPVDMIRSLHARFVYDLNEDHTDLEKAWALQPFRQEGTRVPLTCVEPKTLQYSEVGRLGEQVNRLLQVFPRDQIKYIVFEDFVRDPKKAYEDVCRFLGLSSNGKSDFKKINESRRYYSKRLARFMLRPPFALTLLRRVPPVGVALDKIRSWAVGLNSKPAGADSLRPEFREFLISFFQSDIRLLMKLTGLDLNHWLV
jgi:hypothetical protein